MEVVAEDAVHVDKEGLSLLLLLQDAKKQQETAVRVSGDMGELAEGLGGSCIQEKAKKYDRKTIMMEVFTYTHTKDHDGNTLVNRHALGVNPDHSAEEISALWAHVDEQERQLAELRAHVMRMSGQHGADDNLVTPADTTTHPADTPVDAITLDLAEDRPRRFDFEPF
ncbi:hypothetical protein JCGZ_09794 [Jatropha curcas]|uniref:Uncharacterized protein n=1 Tax=Jatropha curcas TaxID=180498 RepID=A0A067KJL0_JATCU|nr:hypothetical protein JCGZ_09794 [Jatropha curcas]